MKKSKKALILALCALLLVAATVFVTLAFLTSTDKVTNTFTVGDVKITLDERKADTNGSVVTPTQLVKENSYKLIPGHSYTKDPTLHVQPNSEPCYIFVKVEDEIAYLETEYPVVTQMQMNGWKALPGVENVYYQESIVPSKTVAQDFHVFDYLNIRDDVNGTTLAAYKDKTIVVTGYAVQADGFDTAAEAWTAAFGN